MVGQRCCGQRAAGSASSAGPCGGSFTDADPDPDPGTPSDANPLVFNLTPTVTALTQSRAQGRAMRSALRIARVAGERLRVMKWIPGAPLRSSSLHCRVAQATPS